MRIFNNFCLLRCRELPNGAVQNGHVRDESGSSEHQPSSAEPAPPEAGQQAHAAADSNDSAIINIKCNTVKRPQRPQVHLQLADHAARLNAGSNASESELYNNQVKQTPNEGVAITDVGVPMTVTGGSDV